jgi:hypothetical protein
VLGALAGRHATAAAVLVAVLGATLACTARRRAEGDSWTLGLPHAAGIFLGLALVAVPDRLSWGAPAVGSWLSSFLPAVAGGALAVVGTRVRAAVRDEGA